MATEFIAGCVGGVAGVVVGHPFDTIKVLLQTQSPTNPRFNGAIDCIKHTIKSETVKGLYKGMTSPMAGVAVVNAIVFGVHGTIVKNMQNPNSVQSHALAGAGAGFVQAFVTSPMELAKTRMQIQTTGSSNPFSCMKAIVKMEGFKGAFRGQAATLMREIPGFTTYFATYEMLLKKLTPSPSDGPSNAAILVSGGTAGIASWVVTYPIDVIKSRIQADGVAGLNKYNGLAHCLKQSIATEGMSFLARGLSTAVVRAFPTNAVIFAVVAGVTKLSNNEGMTMAQLT